MGNTVAVILVSFNQRSFLRPLFKSFSCQSYRDFCIYFVDNCSSDDSVSFAKILSSEFGLETKYFERGINTGYTGGNNFGVSEAVKDGCKYCLILNSDTELESNCIKSLLETAESDSLVAATGPILLFGNLNGEINTIQEYGAKADFKKYKVYKYFSTESFEKLNTEIPERMEVNYLTGACFFIKSSVYEKAGLFDERYFAYGEEIDLFKRISDLGFKVLVTKKAKVWHHHDWSVKNKKGYYFEYYLIQRNKYLYFRKHYLIQNLILTFIKDMLMYPVYLRWFLRICDFKLSIYYLRGTFAGLINKKGYPVF